MPPFQFMQLADIDGGTSNGDAHRVAVQHLVVLLGGVDQRLGRDAADVEADAADGLFLDADDFFTQLTCANGCDIAARPRANDSNLGANGFHRHFLFASLKVLLTRLSSAAP
jgi:hypothetical protein